MMFPLHHKLNISKWLLVSPLLKFSYSSSSTNVVVVGTGAVGMFYGGKLLESQLKGSLIDTHFLCRSDYDLISKNGFKLISPEGDFEYNESSHTQPTGVSKFHKSVETIPCNQEVDWIILSVKSYALNDPILQTTIKSLISKKRTTKILALMNGLGCEDKLCEIVDSNQIYGGMAFICCNRLFPPIYHKHSKTKKNGNIFATNNYSDTVLKSNSLSSEHHDLSHHSIDSNDKSSQYITNETNDPILIHHIAFGNLLIGHYHDDVSLLSSAQELWKDTSIASMITTTPTLLKARWSKLCWNLPFSGLSVACGGITIDIIKNIPSLRVYADQIMTDTIHLANEDILHYYGETEIGYQNLLNEHQIKEYCWKLTDTMGAYKTSAAIDLSQGSEIEIEYLFNNILKRLYYHRNRYKKQQIDDQQQGNIHNIINEVDNIPEYSSSLSHDRSEDYNPDTCKQYNHIQYDDRNKDNPSLTNHNHNHNKYRYLESLLLMTQSIVHIASIKKKLGQSWTPTFFS